MASLIIKTAKTKLIFNLYDFGGNKGCHFGIEVETPMTFNGPLNNKVVQKSIELEYSAKSYGFHNKDLNNLETWIKNSKLKSSKIVLNKSEKSEVTLSFSHKDNKWSVLMNSISPLTLGYEKFNFDGNYLKNSSYIEIPVLVDNLSVKDLNRLQKWILRARKEIVKIDKRGESW